MQLVQWENLQLLQEEKPLNFMLMLGGKYGKLNNKINELNKTTVDVIKNKLASPFGQAKINILWGHGIDKLGEIIDYAVEFDIINKAGSWFTYNEEKFQGMDKMKDYLEENYEILLNIEKQVLNKINNIKIEENNEKEE